MIKYKSLLGAPLSLALILLLTLHQSMSIDNAFSKEAALSSEHGSAAPGAVDLNAARRAALAEIDNVSRNRATPPDELG